MNLFKIYTNIFLYTYFLCFSFIFRFFLFGFPFISTQVARHYRIIKEKTILKINLKI